MKRLFLDIETSYNIVATFSLYPKFIPHDNILHEWHIICAAWKWEGQKRIYGEIANGKDDKNVVSALRDAIIEADEIVYHNGRKFDFRKLNTRVILNDLPPMPKPREVDTLLQVRKHFGFTSNRLDYLGQILGVGGKDHVSNELWLEALRGKKKALKKMFKYNKRDVTLLEDVFHKVQSHIDVGYNKNLGKGLGFGCPSCGSNNYQYRGWATTSVSKYRRCQCVDCGKWFKEGTREKLKGAVNR